MNQAEFRKLALQEIDSVYRLACHLAARRDEADDLVQETYLRAFKSGVDFKLTPHGPRPYLFKILHNVVYTRASQAHHRPGALAEGYEPAAAAHDSAVETCSELASIDWEKVDERLKHAIAELPLAHRTVFLLCAVEGLRYREIADIVEAPIGTVMSRLYRARQELSAKLSDLAAEHGMTRRKTLEDDGSVVAS